MPTKPFVITVKVTEADILKIQKEVMRRIHDEAFHVPMSCDAEKDGFEKGFEAGKRHATKEAFHKIEKN